MRVPLSWVRELAPKTPIDPIEVGERLTLVGLELDVIEGQAAFSGVVAVRVLDKREIPGARACLVIVDAGPHGRKEIVCGAHNFGPGDLLPAALPGAELPGGRAIARREVKLPKGLVTSDGMLCASDELSLPGGNHDGIFHLESGEPGDDVARLLGLGDPVLVFEITPNRPDALSIAGFAREVRAAFGGELLIPPARGSGHAGRAADGSSGEPQVSVEDGELCRLCTGVAIDGITVGPAPSAVQQRLRAAGMRPINNVVDATNYVMLERGQPLHAYDRDLLGGGGIAVRAARPGERLVTLDGQERVLAPTDAVITDATDVAIGLAGIMGGGATEVSDATTSVLLEAAYFTPTAILRTSKRLGLRTEASLRFERGVAWEDTLDAALRCAHLIAEWSGGTVGGATATVAGDELRRSVIAVRSERVDKLLGTELGAAEQRRLLSLIGLATADGRSGTYSLAVPSRRPDIVGEADVAEEVGRLHGFNRISRSLPAGAARIGSLLPEAHRRRALRRALLGCGLTEVITWSFASRDEIDAIGSADLDAVRVVNPLQSEQAFLRPTLLTGLLRTARVNAAHRRSDLAVFEIGTVFSAAADPGDGRPVETEMLGILLTGLDRTPSPWARPRLVDVFDVKGIVEDVALALRAGEVAIEQVAVPGLHPGRSGRLMIAGADAGLIGELDPDVAARYDIRSGAIALVRTSVLVGGRGGLLEFAPLQRYPVAVRDLSVVVADEVSAGSVAACITDEGGALLASANIVDVFRGAQIGASKKSVTVALSFSDPDRTLTDAEVDEAVGRIVVALQSELGATLRS